nr:smalltalk protein [uncultured Bacteroides sp.]
MTVATAIVGALGLGACK